MTSVEELKRFAGPTGYYDRRGEDAVLLVHGLTGTPTEMRSLAGALKRDGFSVLCPQLAGHCGSMDELKCSAFSPSGSDAKTGRIRT